MEAGFAQGQPLPGGVLILPGGESPARVPWRAPSGVRHAAMESVRYDRPLPAWRREGPIPLAQMSEWVGGLDHESAVRWPGWMVVGFIKDASSA